MNEDDRYDDLHELKTPLSVQLLYSREKETISRFCSSKLDDLSPIVMKAGKKENTISILKSKVFRQAAQWLQTYCCLPRLIQ